MGTISACRLLPVVDTSFVFRILTDIHRARVTTHLRAPNFPRRISVSARDVAQPCFPVPNVFELLLLWIFAAGDDDHIWWNDGLASEITSTFYQDMVDKSGRLDYTRAAFAPNKTM